MIYVVGLGFGVFDFHFSHDLRFSRLFCPLRFSDRLLVYRFTTCWARLHIYKHMRMVEKDLLYVDTDSIVFVHRPGAPLPPTGNILGDLTGELQPGQFIREFVSLGPKSYAYQTNDLKTVTKVKGFTLNGQMEKVVNFTSMVELLMKGGLITVAYPHSLKREKRKFEIHECDLSKRLRKTYDKRRVNPDFTTLPFGFTLY